MGGTKLEAPNQNSGIVALLSETLSETLVLVLFIEIYCPAVLRDLCISRTANHQCINCINTEYCSDSEGDSDQMATQKWDWALDP